jgi:hypothetical protein
MIRGLIICLIMCCAAGARAQDCYYYWVHQCIEVVDASQRQLKQFVLISPAVNYLQAEGQQCSDAVAEPIQPGCREDQRLPDPGHETACPGLRQTSPGHLALQPQPQGQRAENRDSTGRFTRPLRDHCQSLHIRLGVL